MAGMLLGQDFCGCHERGLIAILEGKHHCHQRDNCLSASNVSLKQPVHRLSRRHIVEDLLDHPALSTRQFEWKNCLKPVGDVSRDFYASCFLLALALTTPQVEGERQQKKFLKDEPAMGSRS